MDLRRGHRSTGSTTTSDLPTTTVPNGGDSHLKDVSKEGRRSAGYLSQLLDNPQKRRWTFYAAVATFCYLVYRHYTRPPLPFGSLGQVPTRDAKNWGQYVAFGHARPQMLEHSDPDYPGLGDRYVASLRARIRSNEETEGSEMGTNRLLETRKGAISGDEGFEAERHGIYGGANWDWTTGIVGVGSYLGPLDMRKLSAIPPEERNRLNELDAPQNEALKHYLAWAWDVTDVNEKKHRAEVSTLTFEERVEKGLPMRDIVAGDPKREKEAAELWTRVYAAFHRQSAKSALQLAIEKMVRRIPVVVFTDGEPEELGRVQRLFKRLRLSPEILVIDVQKRREPLTPRGSGPELICTTLCPSRVADGKNLMSFLRHLTSHDTLPNIVIGGRSIGGIEELERLDGEKKLVELLEGAGVKVHGLAY